MFQFTHPRGVRPEGVQYSSPKSRRFNSRTRKGCDEMSCLSSSLNRKFQFTHPRGVRHRPHRRRPLRQAVSIHAPARGATAGQLSLACLAAFQFTHPRGVRHLRGDPLGHAPRVSIHAPARGATYKAERKDNRGGVSIHAPARGATPGRTPAYPHMGCFNSRTREGCDIEGLDMGIPQMSFNSRTREGCDRHLSRHILSR